MRPFEHRDAATVAEALEAARGQSGVCWLAGGTDLLGVLKDEVLPAYPSTLVNLKTIPGLDRIGPDGDGLRLGATARLAAVAGHPLVRARFPALAEAAASVGTPELRAMGTLGGNLCQDTRCWYYRYPHHMGGRLPCLRKGAGPCHAVGGDNRYHAVVGAKGCFAPCPSDTAVALAALHARAVVAGPAGERTVPVGELYTPLGPALADGELVTGVTVPPAPAGARQGFRKFTVRKPVDFALVSVAVFVAFDGDRCREARVWLGGVAPGPHRAAGAEAALAGRALTDDAVAEAADGVLADARPLKGNAYKVPLARALVRRSLRALAP